LSSHSPATTDSTSQQKQQQRQSPLRHNRDFLLIIGGQMVSEAGTQVSHLAFPLLMLLLTNSPSQAGLMGALRAVPYVALALPAGALVDRWNRRVVMVVCDTGRALCLGSVAVALALTYPNLVKGLVLASGYYYPSLRPDVVAMSAPAVPLVGDVLRYTISPIVSRVMWPLLMTKIFGARPVPKKFEGFPKEMALRPSQIRASAAESALMIPGAVEFRDQYANLKMPVSIIAGEEDRLIDIDEQSYRLHGDIAQSNFHRVPGAGHMVHQTATGSVMSAIDQVCTDMAPEPAAKATV